ncbi:protein kinase domain-containing protein [Candidatus Magnetominusculus xianensis]|uniref:Serine/threonine-protein kinase n=1 Tax=Candidatus Magnetominusculus xianensis TaxID=1748249 RepID=A0ABR5SGV2_9BACT|nr:protein kinase [Candidatus Magnetominusculus xianensis]KWT90925.1 serine/threonine-protein kinase [Candidatus Magnetominusculus xianensis]MBF0403080.1 protein kinase [Nitrospirota bacterium]
MPAKIVLKVTEGSLKGTEYVFTDRTTCIIGRGGDCNPRLPDDKDHSTISRHHCLLDINPPGMRVRDFGSLNGTFVNGKKIGQRDRTIAHREAIKAKFPEHDLKDGDTIRLGMTVFRVSITVPLACSVCSKELTGDGADGGLQTDGSYICTDCKSKQVQLEPVKKPQGADIKRCTNCGNEFPFDPDASEILCASCIENPLQLIKQEAEDDSVNIKGYKVINELGKGGMGAVYLAEQTGTGQKVALKVMLSSAAVNDRAREMFLREVENTKHLKHPNVVGLLDYGNSQGTFYFTLEYCEGGSVDKIMARKGGKLSVAEATHIILQALDGLIYAHNIQIPNVKLTNGSIVTINGLVHRDIKPSNIFYTDTPQGRIAKIADFGLGKAFDAAGLSGYTRTGSAAGTPVFMARQQVINFKYSKPEADVWAMAATYYFLLTGRFPRDFPKGKDPWYIVLQTSCVPIQRRNQAIPKNLAEVIDTALVDQPEIIFKTAESFKKALEGVL